jgi:rare lipoprotein A
MLTSQQHRARSEPARLRGHLGLGRGYLRTNCRLMKIGVSTNGRRRALPGGHIRRCCHRVSQATGPLLIGLIALSGCSYLERPGETVRHFHKPTAVSSKYQHREVGKASWYGPGFQNKHTASGEVFDQNKLTAGSRTLPLGTVVEVTNLKNGKRVQVKVNDRGPWVRGRTIDLSQAAANKLGMVKTGVAPVKIKVIAKRGLRHHPRHKRRRTLVVSRQSF